MITVVIPTHNPREEILRSTIEGLLRQTLSTEQWRLLLIDNASSTALEDDWVEWHPQGEIVREERLGLTHARLKALELVTEGLIVWVDDDNRLHPTYLEAAEKAFEFEASPDLGAAGGKSIANYLETPPQWFEEGLAPLGCRDLGEEGIIASWDSNRPEYPPCAPIGAGMVTRREALEPWYESVLQDPLRQQLGRSGTRLTSGEDNDMNLSMLRNGWQVAYFPQLELTHSIPAGRLTQSYLSRMARASFRDFVRVLDLHGIRPWPAIPEWSVWPRLLKAGLQVGAWKGPAERIRWNGLRGQYEGRALLQSRASAA